MGKQIVIYPHNKILLSNKNKQNMGICDNMSESQNDYAKCKKPDRKTEYTMISFI